MVGNRIKLHGFNLISWPPTKWIDIQKDVKFHLIYVNSSCILTKSEQPKGEAIKRNKNPVSQADSQTERILYFFWIHIWVITKLLPVHTMNLTQEEKMGTEKIKENDITAYSVSFWFATDFLRLINMYLFAAHWMLPKIDMLIMKPLSVGEQQSKVSVFVCLCEGLSGSSWPTHTHTHIITHNN